MHSNSGISVIIPVYNAEKYLNICVASLLKQTFQNLELIFVIDKNSTDNSEEIIREYANQSELIKVINSDYDGGAGYNRNIGINCATKEFIGFVDADDCVSADYYEILYKSAAENYADVAIADTIMLDENDKVVFTSRHEFKILSNFCEIYSELDYSTVWDKIYKTSLLKSDEDLLFPSGVIHEDNIFTLRVLQRADKVITSPGAKYFWRRHKNSVTNLETNYQKCLDDAVLVFDQVLDFIDETDLTTDEKFAILKHNLENYAGLLFKANYKSDYFRQKLVSIFGINKTYEMLMSVISE